MSDTPKLADECKKLLDSGWDIKLFRNQLGSYTAQARRPVWADGGMGGEPVKVKTHLVETDDFEPSQALYRLTEKVFGNIA